MARPGFVLEVDERTPPLLVRSGASLRLQKFSLGTQVVYAPDGEPWTDPAGLVTTALTKPTSGEALADVLRPGMVLTITFSDVSVPVPAAHHDVRQVMVEQVLQAAAEAGVDDVALIAANGLRRRLTDDDLLGMLGERVCRSFAGDQRLRSHDVEDDAELVSVGEVDGEAVRINRRVVESDLVVHVGVVTEAGQGGWAEIVAGLGSAATIDLACGLRHRLADVVDVVSAAVPAVAVSAVLGQPAYTGMLRFLSGREWEWGIGGRARYLAVRRALAAAPAQTRHALYDGPAVHYPILSVVNGPVAEVEAAVGSLLARSQRVELSGQADILVAGVPAPVPQAPDGDGTPLVSAWSVLAHSYGLASGVPLVREGGAIIAFDPLSDRFGSGHHSAAADFFAEVLPATLDPQVMADTFQARFASDPWYLELYRGRNAFHPLHPFHLWYAMQPAIRATSDIVWVGADRRNAEAMGFRAASTYTDALEIVATRLGRRPSITYLRPTGQVQVAVQ